MKKLFLIPVLLLGLTACAGSGQVSGEVCAVGAIVCNVSSIICESVPELPPEVCKFLDIACINLNLICATEPGTTEHDEAVESLNKANIELNKYIQEYKDKTE